MGSKQKTIVVGSWLLALMSLVAWSISQTVVVMWATSRHPKVAPSSELLQEPALTNFKRSEQLFFQDYGLYIPLEDIMVVEQLSLSGNRFADVLKRSCSNVNSSNGHSIWSSGIAIWLPLKFKLPLLGERIVEWCWKPPMHREK
jgi:hypothetical protein